MFALLLLVTLIVCLLTISDALPAPESSLSDYDEQEGHTTLIADVHFPKIIFIIGDPCLGALSNELILENPVSYLIGYNPVVGDYDELLYFLQVYVKGFWRLIRRPVQQRAALFLQLLKQVRMNTLFGRGILHA